VGSQCVRGTSVDTDMKEHRGAAPRGRIREADTEKMRHLHHWSVITCVGFKSCKERLPQQYIPQLPLLCGPIRCTILTMADGGEYEQAYAPALPIQDAKSGRYQPQIGGGPHGAGWRHTLCPGGPRQVGIGGLRQNRTPGNIAEFLPKFGGVRLHVSSCVCPCMRIQSLIAERKGFWREKGVVEREQGWKQLE
jgi:hypothetical protein